MARVGTDVFTPPADLSDDDVAREVLNGWGIRASQVEYRAVGFGSHHWQLRSTDADWFVTVDPEPQPGRSSLAELETALTVSRRLADDGMRSVLAPVAALDGRVLRLASFTRSAGRYAISLFPYVAAPTVYESGTSDPLAVVPLLAELHERTGVVEGVASRAVLDAPGREGLLARLDAIDGRWNSGPYAENARVMLRARAPQLRELIDAYAWVQQAIEPQGWVITHGEPHDRNLLLTEHGIVLIDWDTARIAPAARDLWQVGGGAAVDAYIAITGRRVDARDLALYRARWDLDEIALYAAQFAAPHEDTADAREALGEMTESLERVPALLVELTKPIN